MPLTHGDGEHEDSGPWPALADLLAATALIFLVLFAAIAIPAIKRKAELEGLRTSIDTLEVRLRAAAGADRGVSVRRVGDYLLVQIPESATFRQREYELAQLQQHGKNILRELGDTIRHLDAGARNQRTLGLIDQVHVVGHASAEGGEEFNWRISAARAATIALFLTDSVRLPPCMVSALGRSHYYPVSPDSQRRRRTEDARDRRIELEIRPQLPDDEDQARRRTEECVAARLGEGRRR